jgi:ABC-type antimicrobial peptide transport system permease subunit
MGGKRLSLIRLFLSESTLVAFIAGSIAIVLVLMILPAFNILIGKPLALDLTDGWLWLAGLIFILFTGLLAGSYPAFHLSSFMPVKVLKGTFKKGRKLLAPRRVLVVVQFTVAVFLISATFVIHRQVHYVQNRDNGYNKEHLIYQPMTGDIGKNYELIKHELINSGVATSVTRTFAPMTQLWADAGDVQWKGSDPDRKTSVDIFIVDADWTKTVGTTIIEGRDIDISTYSTDENAILLNEAAVKMMNFEDPIGEIINWNGRDWHVIGVIEDFIIRSPYEPTVPMLIGGTAGWFSFMHIKLNDNNSMTDNLVSAKQIFGQFNPSYPFEYNFIDEEHARKFHEEQKMGTLATGFAGLTIFISCMGLFALVAFMAETRRKEIGIRKVLGASVTDVVFLLSKEFLILVLISVAVASPVAWWAMEKWLSNYAYRTDIPWWLFVVVGCISLCIALLTVGFQALKAATANPVKANLEF